MTLRSQSYSEEGQEGQDAQRRGPRDGVRLDPVGRLRRRLRVGGRRQGRQGQEEAAGPILGIQNDAV